MSNYRNTRSYENLERRIFPGVGAYDIPQLAPVDYEGGCEFIGFNYAKSCKTPLRSIRSAENNKRLADIRKIGDTEQ